MSPIVADIIRTLPSPKDGFKDQDDKKLWWKMFEAAIDYLYPPESKDRE